MSQENIYITQIRLGRKTKEQVIINLKGLIKNESDRLSQSIAQDSSFLILDLNHHITRLTKLNKELFEVINHDSKFNHSPILI